MYNKNDPIILSASRMTDMPKYYFNELINEISKRIHKGIDIHTVVLWTKHPDSLFNKELFVYLNYLKSINIGLYLHCTITGMGGIIIGKDKYNRPLYIEPNAPKMSNSLQQLKEIIEFLETTQRIRIRIDPIIRIRNTITGETYTNLNCLEPIINNASKLGIREYTISFLEKNAHKKVSQQFNKIGWDILPPDDKERIKTQIWLEKLSSKYKINISACCIYGFPKSRCINGYLLENLHPLKKPTNKSEPTSRPLCGCTHSIDIGGWPPKKCHTGCQYCYANSSYKKL